MTGWEGGGKGLLRQIATNCYWLIGLKTGFGIRSFALFSFAQNCLFKEWPWANRSCRSLKNINHEQILLKRTTWVFLSWFEQITLKTSDLLEKIHIFVCFWQFFTAFPLFMSKSELLSSLFAPVAHYKRATVSKSLFRSFAHKNWAIRLKNQRANFPPCCQVAE